MRAVRIKEQHIGNTGGYSLAFHYRRFGSVSCAAVTDSEQYRAQIRELQREPFHARFLYVRFDVSHDDESLKRWVVGVMLLTERLRDVRCRSVCRLLFAVEQLNVVGGDFGDVTFRAVLFVERPCVN